MNPILMPEIILIAGLPGSGKTTWGSDFIKENSDSIFIDDISIITGNAKEFLKKIKQENIPCKNLLISDVFMCRKEVREKALKVINEVFPCAKTRVLFFENSIEKCKKNVKRRMALGDERKVQDMITVLSRDYAIPEGSEIVPVYSCEVNKNNSVPEITKARRP